MFFKTTTSAMALTALMAGPSFADLSPADVWQNWVEYYTSAGMDVTEGSREDSGGTLVVHDLVIGFADEDGKLAMKVPSISMEDAGDGKVRMTMAPEMTAELDVAAPDGEAGSGDLSLAITMAQTDSEMLVSGTPDDQVYEISMPELVMTLDKVVADGQPVDLPMMARFVDTTGSYRHTKTGDGRRVVQDLKTGKVEFSGKGMVPEVEGEAGAAGSGPKNFEFTGSYDGLTMAFDTLLPADTTMDNLDAALKAGMAISGTFGFGKSEVNGTMSGPTAGGPDQTVTAKSVSDSSTLGFAMSQDGIAYNGTGGATSVELTTSMMPFPIKYGIQSAAFDLAMPVSAREEAQPYKLAMNVGGLTIGDEIWGLFDPTAQLPRDPATIDIDVSGDAMVTADIFDPEFLQGSDAAGTPFVPVDMKIAKFFIQAIGAKVEASGELAARDGATFAEQPVGNISARLEGVNTAMDKLISLGLLNPESAMQARMMLGMMTRPVEGAEDTQTSEVEFGEDGSVFVNGQQMQ